jgi:hypothetical protein
MPEKIRTGVLLASFGLTLCSDAAAQVALDEIVVTAQKRS